MKEAVLSAKGLCKSFAHNGGQVHILSHIDLDLYEGDFTVIMGASGSGKSTLLYALSGMDRATSGKVMYNGNDIVKMKEKELAKLRHTDFGFIFQQMHLVSNLTLFENVAVPGYLNKSKAAPALMSLPSVALSSGTVKQYHHILLGVPLSTPNNQIVLDKGYTSR